MYKKMIENRFCYFSSSLLFLEEKSKRERITSLSYIYSSKDIHQFGLQWLYRDSDLYLVDPDHLEKETSENTIIF